MQKLEKGNGRSLETNGPRTNEHYIGRLPINRGPKWEEIWDILTEIVNRNCPKC